MSRHDIVVERVRTKRPAPLRKATVSEQLLLEARWENARLQRRIDVLEARIRRGLEIVRTAEDAHAVVQSLSRQLADLHGRYAEAQRALKARRRKK